MHLDDQAVGAGSGGRQGAGGHQPGHAGGVAGVHDDGQVGQLVEHGHGGDVQGVAGVVAEGADAPLTEDHPLVAAGHDVFGAHQQLLQGVGQAALEQDGLVHLAQLPKQVKVLHIPGTHLQHIHILKQRQVCHAHDLGDEGQARLLPGDL